MNLKIQNGAIEINGNTILENINFEVNDGEHIAIVGRNGAGKTTLLNSIIDNELLIKGISDSDFKITKMGNIRIGYLKQIKINEALTLFEELASSYKELKKLEIRISELENCLTNDKNILEYSNVMDRYEKLGGYIYKKNIEVMVKKFKFSESDKDKKISEFSGGEKTKISFMKLLLSNPDLLILDEPTNHLDISTIEWLEDYLKNYKKAVIVVSHDRMFLDNVANIVYEIEYGETIKYIGNYTKYLELKKDRYNKLVKDYEFQQNEIKRLNSLFERFRYKPTKAKMALSKLKQIERMDLIDKPKKEDTRTFKANIKDIQKPGKIVLSVNDLKFGYDNSLGNLSLQVIRGKKIGIIGPNGIGKSTFLKTLSKIIPALSGDIIYGHNVKPVYFDQNLKFKTNDSIYEEFQNMYPQLSNEGIRNALGSFLFTGEDVNKKINVLSGGEKVRLLLCEVFFSKANLMFLDEPTNHLDIIGKEKLENTLKEYPETIIFVSHDRYFVREIADELLVFEDDKIKYYQYGYEEYIRDRKDNEVEKNLSDNKKLNAKERVKSNKQNKPKINLNKLEKEIGLLYNQIDDLNKEFCKEEIYSNYKKSNELNNQIEEIKKEIAIKEEEWEQLILSFIN